MGLSNDNKTGYASNTLKTFTTASNEVWPNPSWSTFIIRTLLKNKKLEYQYINTFCDYLNTHYHADTATALLNKMAKRIESEIPYHQKRWKTTVDSWTRNVEIIREFVQKRPDYLFQYIDEKFGLDTLIEVSVKVPDNNVCDIKLNSIDISRDFNGKYFTNVPQKIKVNPKHDYELVAWKDRSEKTLSIEFTATKNVVFEPIIQPKDSSQYQHQVIFNEINFMQIKDDSIGDWIELYNLTDEPIDLKGWVLTDQSYKKGKGIKEGIIKANSYAVLARNSQRLIELNGVNQNQIVGDFNFGLSKKGELLKLYDMEGRIVDYLKYDTSYAMIDSTFSLALMVPDSTHNNPHHWLVQVPSPAGSNPSYIDVIAKKVADEAEKKLWIQIGVAIGVAVLLLIGILFFRRRKSANE
jgi:hypothetical protein